MADIKLFAQDTPGFLNASVAFDLETLRPTYHLVMGLFGSSNALAIAQRLGLPKPFIAHARELMGETPMAIERAIKQADGARRALDRERTVATRSRQEAEETAARLKRELGEVDEKKQATLAKARDKAHDVLQQARMEANALLEELRAAVRETREQTTSTAPPSVADLRRKAQHTLKEMANHIEELPAAPPPVETTPAAPPVLGEVTAGQPVFVPHLDCRGIALDAGRGDEEVTVQVGIMQVRIRVADLAPARATLPGYHHPPAAVSAAQAPYVDPELHLLGKRAEEAHSSLDEYLYDALEQGLSRVRIVHGFGTGTLRHVVQELLRHHPAVRSYRQGEQHEGGGGVTIAEVGMSAE